MFWTIVSALLFVFVGLPVLIVVGFYLLYGFLELLSNVFSTIFKATATPPSYLKKNVITPFSSFYKKTFLKRSYKKLTGTYLFKPSWRGVAEIFFIIFIALIIGFFIGLIIVYFD